LLRGSSILVTGGSGFIGSHLVNRLIKEGCKQVIVFDKQIRHNKFQSSNNLRTIQGEVTDIEKLQGIMSGIDYVFHMAVLPLNTCTENPRACLEVNINGTFNVLEAAQKAKVKKIVFSSASSVYGDTEETMDESHPLNARTMYGASKISGEYFLRAFYDMYKLDYVILRYMNVYGPAQEGGLIMNVLRRIRSGLPPIILGDGSQSFDFVYVDDVVAANILAMESDVTDEALNIGGEEEVSVKELVYTLLDLTGSNLTPEFKLNEKVPMQRRVGSSQKAARLLGYAPKVPLKEGLRKVIKAELKT
jgi:UDP-glucose 4-epimerase